MGVNQKIWLSSPHMGGSEKEYVDKAFSENWIAPLGPNVDGFESDIAHYLLGSDTESSNVACLSSGTSALHLALILSGVGAGDEVICQSMTFSASANPIVYQGASPVFVDSEEETWNICPHALKECISDRISKGNKPKAMIIVHLYGMPAKMDEVLSIAQEYDIKVIEDSAEALGSTYKGRKCGTLGDFGILSFNGNKIITTSGGGALVCGSGATKQRAVFLATQSRDDAPHYQHSQIGYNYRMSNVIAGIGRGQMKVLDERVLQRRFNNSFYREVFEDKGGVDVFSEPNTDFYSNHWLSCIVINENIAGFDREQLRLALLEDHIESRPLWKPMHMQPVFKKCAYYGQKNVSEKLFQQGLCLPSGSNLSDDDRAKIRESISRFM